MASLYYVYMRWYKESDNRSSQWARQLLTCESRYVADELFRACQELKNSRGKLRFTRLERNNPQFWLYDTTDGDPWMCMFDILGAHEGMPDSIMGRIMPTLLHDGPGRIYNPAPVIPGRDWLNHGLYFIRNIRQPELYWTIDPTTRHVLISDKIKARFRISSQYARDDKKKRVLIRSDTVSLSLPNEIFAQGPTMHIRIASDGCGLVCVADSAGFTFRFGDFLGNFGTRWVSNQGSDVDIHEFVTWHMGGEQDDWELC
ncbi:hypothetical protein DFP73DRAFT_487657 [Morchella snyderi]|nr:hypothetical protein DFP73DRAFT_487657 [Morchella snyderi]